MGAPPNPPVALALSVGDPSPAMPKLKTFLVEDSAVIRANLVAALEDLAPVEVVGHAESAAEAQERLEALVTEGRCDLVIVDIFLRGGSGLDVLRHVSRHDWPIRPVVLTNYATPDIRAECLALGADQVFDKSRDIDALVDYCNDMAAD